MVVGQAGAVEIELLESDQSAQMLQSFVGDGSVAQIEAPQVLQPLQGRHPVVAEVGAVAQVKRFEMRECSEVWGLDLRLRKPQLPKTRQRGHIGDPLVVHVVSGKEMQAEEKALKIGEPRKLF